RASTASPATGWRRRAWQPTRSGLGTRLPLPHVGSTRRRTRASRPSCSPNVAPIVPARLAGTTCSRTARGPRTPPATTGRSPCCRQCLLVLAHPVTHRLVEVPDEDLLVVEREVGECSRLEPHLRAVECSGVLQRVLLDGNGGVFPCQALASGRGGNEPQ